MKRSKASGARGSGGAKKSKRGHSGSSGSNSNSSGGGGGGGGGGGAKGSGRPSTKALTWVDEEIESSDSDEEGARGGKRGTGSGNALPEDGDGDDDDDDGGDETAEQRRKRLAMEYLASMQDDDDDDDDDGPDDEADGDYDNDGGTRGNGFISDRLRRERLEAQGKYFRDIASSVAAAVSPPESLVQLNISGHKQSVTCVELSSDEATIYSGSKDNSVISWDTETGKKKALVRPRWSGLTHGSQQSCDGEVLCVASTTDGKFVVSSGRDKAIRVHDVRLKHAEVKCFQGHRDVVTCLAFRRDSYSLFSGSMDRCLKHWDLNEMGYLETMFGHQDYVNAVDCWTQEKPVSASNDRTLRIWKVSDESHLVLRGHKGNIDCVSILTDSTFLSGSQDGQLSLWKDTQKKPVLSVAAAHGLEQPGVPRWIISSASIKMSDLAASGSHDGFVRLWNAKVAADTRSLEQVYQLPVNGFVNALAISSNLLVAGTGQEHRLGRWWHSQGSFNRVVVWRLPTTV